MADQGRTRNVTLYRTTNLCLVLILAYGILCIAIFLLVKGAVCSTTSPGIDFSLGFVRQSRWRMAIARLTLAVCSNDCRRRAPLLPDLSAEAKAPDHITFSRPAATRFCLRCWSSMFDVPLDDFGVLQSARGSKSSHLSQSTTREMAR